MAKFGEEIFNPRTGQRMRFLKTSQYTDGQLLQIECRNLPSGIQEPEHIHPSQVNRFKMISGSLMFNVAGKERRLSAGESLSISAGIPHFFWNNSDSEAHYIQEFQPALRTELFFETLFALARNGQLNANGLPNPFAMAVLVPSFWNEIRVTKPPQVIQQLLCALLAPVSRRLGYRPV